MTQFEKKSFTPFIHPPNISGVCTCCGEILKEVVRKLNGKPYCITCFNKPKEERQ